MASADVALTALADELVRELPVRLRNDGAPDARGRIIYWLGSGATVAAPAQVCVGRGGHTRLNFREPLPSLAREFGVVLGGDDQEWRGGGIVIDQDNLPHARALLVRVLNSEVEPPAGVKGSGVGAAGAQLRALVGNTIHTLSGQPNTVLRLEGDSVIVGTNKSPEGQTVPIAWVQAGIDRLLQDGSVRVDIGTVGYRSAFVGAVLLTLPGARAEGDPARVVLSEEWPLSPGETIRRVDVHARFGGSGQNGISPSRKTPNVFVFSDPARGEQHGYFDHWAEGVFHYAGQGQHGDQTLTGGNKRSLTRRKTSGRCGFSGVRVE